MDPISASANIIALVGFTCKSCQALHAFFRGLSEARGDIMQFCSTLKSLESTLQCINSLCTDSDITPHLSHSFTDGLKACYIELETVESRCRKARKMLQKGRMSSSWARLRWYLSAEHWLKRFFARIQTYQMLFSLELSTLQTQVCALRCIARCKG